MLAWTPSKHHGLKGKSFGIALFDTLAAVYNDFHSVQESGLEHYSIIDRSLGTVDAALDVALGAKRRFA